MTNWKMTLAAALPFAITFLAGPAARAVPTNVGLRCEVSIKGQHHTFVFSIDLATWHFTLRSDGGMWQRNGEAQRFQFGNQPAVVKFLLVPSFPPYMFFTFDTRDSKLYAESLSGAFRDPLGQCYDAQFQGL